MKSPLRPILKVAMAYAMVDAAKNDDFPGADDVLRFQGRRAIGAKIGL